MFNVKTANGDIIQLDFDTMTDEELKNLKNSVSAYMEDKKERDIRKSVDAIINFIETEMKRCPDLEDRTAIIVNGNDYDKYFDWDELLSLIKDIYY